MIKEILEDKINEGNSKTAKRLAKEFIQGLWEYDESFTPTMDNAITEGEIKSYAKERKIPFVDGDETNEIVTDLKDDVLSEVNAFFKKA